MKIIAALKNQTFIFRQKKHLKKLRERNRNHDFTLITNNCIGGIIYHNLGLRFRSPTINLYIKGKEYLVFCENIEYYLSCDLEEEADNNIQFPVGVLRSKDGIHMPIHIYFQHYKSFHEAKLKWVERCQRVNWGNIYFLWEFYDEVYDTELIKEFDRLPIKKYCLLHSDIEGIQNKIVFDCYKNANGKSGMIFKNDGLSGKRYLDRFDYVSFLNED